MNAAVIPATMTVWARVDYGSADGVHLTEMPVPRPGRGEVLLRIHATALNAGDARLMLGDPLLIRVGFGLRGPKQPVRGMDVAGTIVAVGDGVSADRIGAEVIVELKGGGGLAPFAIAAADRLVIRPAELDAAVAAALLIAGGTAVQALDLADVQPGQRILVIGASGGVGTSAVQLAALRGAEVWATCGDLNRGLVQRLGAIRTFDYRQMDLGTLPASSFDAIIDIAGAAPLRQLKRLLVPTGVVAMVAGSGGRVFGPMPRMLRALFLSIGSRRRIRPVIAVSKREIIEELVVLTIDGRITPVIERTVPWDAAREGLARVESGRTVGKIVVLGQE